MLRLTIPRLSDEILFEALLEPTALVVKSVRRKGFSEGEITTIRGKKNKVAVGVPFYENLIPRLIEEGRELPHQVKQMSDDFDFHWVSLSCSFLPDTDCRFIWARFGVELSATSESGEPCEEKPIVYDMFPDEVLSEIKYRREVEFAPGLKFDLGIVNADMKLIDIKTEREFIVYEPQIIAYGVNTPKAIWEFKRTEEKEIFGNKKDLLLIIRTLKNSDVKGRFFLGAEVEFKIGKWIPIPLSKREEKAVDAEYAL